MNFLIPTISNAVEEIALSKALHALEVAKLAANRRRRYIAHLRISIKRFIRHIGDVAIHTVTTEAIELWLCVVGKNPWSRSTYTARLSTLFEFARRRRWVHENPCEFLERPSVEQPSPKILTPEEAHILVGHCRSDCRRAFAWLVLALFAGMRPEEAAALDWSKIDPERRRIWVDSSISKVRRMRIIEPVGCFWELIHEAKEMEAQLPIPHVARRRMMRKLRERMLWDVWPKDITRHSCASYWLALVPDAPRIALQLGNSPQILLRHYRSLVTQEEARRFFSIKSNGHSEPWQI